MSSTAGTVPAMTTARVLGQRALNRALLARQLLLERDDRRVIDAVRLLYGLQAQSPWSPYHSLWARLATFDPHELGALLTDQRAVRIVAMRGTVHLLAVDDALALRHLHAGFLARSLETSQWQRGMAGLDLAAVADAGRALVEDEPLEFGALGARLAERWPDRDPATLAQVVRARVPLVQVPPRAVWGRSGRVRVTSIEDWVGRPLDATATPADMVLRYLAVYGPASVMDVQAWSGLTRLREVADGLGDRVARFRNEAGRALLDLPDAPRPDPDTPAPVRYLPDYDNVLLSHADRTRLVDDAVRRRLMRANGAIPGTVLLDGRVGAQWTIDRSGGAATLRVTPFRALTSTERVETEAEGARLLELVAGSAGARDVVVLRPEP